MKKAKQAEWPLKYLYDWRMHVDATSNIAALSWMDKDGPHVADVPLWLLGKIHERIEERGLFLGIGHLLGGTPDIPGKPKRQRSRG